MGGVGGEPLSLPSEERGGREGALPPKPVRGGEGGGSGASLRGRLGPRLLLVEGRGGRRVSASVRLKGSPPQPVRGYEEAPNPRESPQG